MHENSGPLIFLCFPHGLSYTFPSDRTYGPTSKNSVKHVLHLCSYSCSYPCFRAIFSEISHLSHSTASSLPQPHFLPSTSSAAGLLGCMLSCTSKLPNPDQVKWIRGLRYILICVLLPSSGVRYIWSIIDVLLSSFRRCADRISMPGWQIISASFLCNDYIWWHFLDGHA